MTHTSHLFQGYALHFSLSYLQFPSPHLSTLLLRLLQESCGPSGMTVKAPYVPRHNLNALNVGFDESSKTPVTCPFFLSAQQMRKQALGMGALYHISHLLLKIQITTVFRASNQSLA